MASSGLQQQGRARQEQFLKASGVGDVYAFLVPVQLHYCQETVNPTDKSRLDQVITQKHRHSLAAPVRPATVMVTMDTLTGKG